jgi:hypothetical protein
VPPLQSTTMKVSTYGMGYEQIRRVNRFIAPVDLDHSDGICKACADGCIGVPLKEAVYLQILLYCMSYCCNTSDTLTSHFQFVILTIFLTIYGSSFGNNKNWRSINLTPFL